MTVTVTGVAVTVMTVCNGQLQVCVADAVTVITVSRGQEQVIVAEE